MMSTTTTSDEPPAAAELAAALAELGESCSADDVDELARRLERDKISDLYVAAIRQSVAIKRRRLERREARQLQRLPR